MKYLNIMDNKYRDEYEMIVGNNFHVISLSCRKHGKYYLPDIFGNFKIWFKFREMTVENYWMIDKITRIDNENTDYEEFVKLFLKFQLVEWNLNIKLEFDNNGWLTDKCFKDVLALPFPLIETFINKYQETFIIDKEYEKIIDRQCGVLFSKNSRGVENACNAISLYCIMSNMWEKFGLNRFDLKNLSYREYHELRLILSKESDKHRAERSADDRRKRTNIVGKGGKSRASRGITIENPS